MFNKFMQHSDPAVATNQVNINFWGFSLILFQTSYFTQSLSVAAQVKIDSDVLFLLRLRLKN